MTRDDGPRSAAGLALAGGEMAERTRRFDWSKTPVGPIDDWPQGLKTAVRIMLGSRYAMWLGWGPEFTFFYNDAYAAMTLGPKHPWALGRSAREVWSEIWPDVGPRAESVLRTGEATWDEGLLLFLERSGLREETYHTFSYSPLPDDDGRVGGMLCVVTEDTERTIGERRLRTLRELAARTTDEARSAEDACQTAARILAGNPQDVPFVLLYLLSGDGGWAELAGLSGVTRAMPTSPAVIEASDPGGAWPFRQVIEAGASVEVHDLSERFGPLQVGVWPEPPQHAVVLPLAQPGLSQLAGFLVAGVSPRRPFDDSYRGFLDLVAGQIATGVSNARAYEEERRRAEALAELDRAKTAFFSNVSHEFRTPLTLMLGPVEDTLAAGDLPSGAKDRLELVNRNGLRLLRLVNSMLDFSRIEAGRVRAVYRPTDLAAFTADLASVFRSACERAGLRLLVDCPPLLEPAYVDREMWEKVVLNLLSNAFKFTFEGEIVVTLRQAGRTAELRVRDTGTGIPAEEMPKLFERFHRIENARGRTHEGSGIGLALVQELARLHGGSVTAESAVGEGTTFVVTLPLGSAHLPPEQVEDGGAAASAGAGMNPFVEEALRWLPDDGRAERNAGLEEPPPEAAIRPEGVVDDDRPRVLVADDNADMRNYVVRLLSERHHIEAVGDGEAALAAARRLLPDLVLTDVMMPRLDGYGLLRELRADPRTSGLPVIMLSARAGEESRVEGMEAGADDYLVKPFSARELLARVGSHIQIARLRRQSEQAVRAEEERLRMALTAARMLAWRFDPTTDEVSVTGDLADVFGLPPGTTLDSSRQGFTLVHPDDADRHRATVARAVEECGSYLSHFRMIRPDNGAVIWLEERGHGVCDGPVGNVRLIGVVMDITDRKRAEHELQRERDLLSVTLGSIGDAVITTDTEGRVTNLNAVAESLTGWTAAEAAGVPLTTVFAIVNEETRAEVENPALRALRDGVIVGLANHTILIARDGTERPIDDSAAPIRAGGGETLGAVLVFRDISERKAAEQALRESEARYRLVGEAANDAIWDWDLVTNAVAWNPGVRTLFGYAEDDVGPDGAWWLAQIHPDDRERISESIHAVIDGAGERWSDEYRFRRADGSYATVFDRGRVVRDGGRPVRMVGSMLDLTERKRAEEELRRVAAELSEANRRKNEFLATLGHELRNPLAPIRMGVEVLRMAGDDPETRDEMLGTMERQTQQMVRLIDDLLDISRITSGKLELRRAEVELAEVVRNAVEATRPFIDEAGHELTVSLPPQPLRLDADPSRLAQVLANLLNNSAKYTPEGGRIRLTAERQGSDVVVTVADNGVGIPADMQVGIFEMFTQIDRPLEKGYRGLGIGLTLVRRLVEMHGGSVRVRSDGEGKGSEFSVRLPVLVEQRAAEPGRPLRARAEGGTGRLRVLVVDDNKAAADLLGTVVRMLGNEVRAAYDGAQGVRAAEEFRPDVVLMDLGMPNMNGYEAARHIRAQPWGEEMALIALTGWGQDEDRQRTKEAGFDRHLVKPAEPAALQDIFAGLSRSRV